MNLSCNLYGRYYKCMTTQKENRVAAICNAVLVRSEADSNRCTRFCRPLPSHSAIRPKDTLHIALMTKAYRKSTSIVSECKYRHISRICKKIIRDCSYYFPLFFASAKPASAQPYAHIRRNIHSKCPLIRLGQVRTRSAPHSAENSRSISACGMPPCTCDDLTLQNTAAARAIIPTRRNTQSDVIGGVYHPFGSAMSQHA